MNLPRSPVRHFRKKCRSLCGPENMWRRRENCMVFWKTIPVRKIHLDEIPQIVYDMQLEKERNFEMDELKIARINELYRKSKAEGLTEAEKEEQKLLRAEYIESIRRNLRSQLDNIDIQEKDGSITNLGDKFDRKKRAN